jgi:hypothetical protein|tara:strand:+ start:10647 stop:11003 length:357 start_codon:yes stop_codon:yes gene_type:complete
MADVFKRFIANLTTTDLTTVFTVPTANVAASPPVPVSTFIVKTINTHNYDGSAAVTVNLDHHDGSNDFQIFQIDVSASNTNTINSSMVYQEGDKLKLQANAASRAMVEISVLEVKQQL